MKELSIEQKAKRYDEAIEKFSVILGLNTVKESGTIFTDDVIKIFPELKESEDERIRKEIIKYFKKYQALSLGDYNVQDILAWLEKQGEPVEINPTEFDTRLQALIGKFGSLPKEELIGSLSFWMNVVQNDGTYKPVEKQAEQKPTDKIEPKFKVGEWITNGEFTWYIKKVGIGNGFYDLKSPDGRVVDDTISHVDEQFHSFTIKDAKDGDVLVVNDNTQYQWIEIFKEHTGCTFTSYCHYNTGIDEFITNKARCRNHGTGKYSNIHPATKEQSDLLFAKMRESGYEWNAEKKELRKIINEEQIKKNLQDNGFRRMFEQKSAWSEEDETGLTNTIIMLKEGASLHFNKKDVTKAVDWLKSLRPKSTWLPSDEQINALDSTLQYSQVSHNSFEHLNSLFNDLKKLREE